MIRINECSLAKIKVIRHNSIWNNEWLRCHVWHVLNSEQLTISIHYLLLLWTTHILVVFFLELNCMRHLTTNCSLNSLLWLVVLNLCVKWLLLLMQYKWLKMWLLTIWCKNHWIELLRSLTNKELRLIFVRIITFNIGARYSNTWSCIAFWGTIIWWNHLFLSF